MKTKSHFLNIHFVSLFLCILSLGFAEKVKIKGKISGVGDIPDGVTVQAKNPAQNASASRLTKDDGSYELEIEGGKDEVIDLTYKKLSLIHI